jgi:hypothetical protein
MVFRLSLRTGLPMRTTTVLFLAIWALGADAPQTQADKELSGIYKLEKATLTVCYRFGTQVPPSEFRTAIGANTMIQVFKQTK